MCREIGGYGGDGDGCGEIGYILGDVGVYVVEEGGGEGVVG